MQSYINSPFFKSGDWVSTPAILHVNLNDSSGIQFSGSELGHDLKLIIDDSVIKNYNLNAFFTYNLNQYQSGVIDYPLPILEAGKHRLILKAWDLLGNVSKDTIWIEVPGEKSSNTRNLQVTPNPVRSNAKFSFEIKNTTDPITVQLEVFDPSGIRHFSMSQKIQPSGNKIMMDWNGQTNNGGLMPAGLYYYKVIVLQNGQYEQMLNGLLKF